VRGRLAARLDGGVRQESGRRGRTGAPETAPTTDHPRAAAALLHRRLPLSPALVAPEVRRRRAAVSDSAPAAPASARVRGKPAAVVARRSDRRSRVAGRGSTDRQQVVDDDDDDVC